MVMLIQIVLKKWLMKMKIKWVNGQCRHLCCVCTYRNQCDDSGWDEELTWKEM